MYQTLTLTSWQSSGNYEFEYACDYRYRNGELVGASKRYYTGRSRYRPSG